MAFYPSKLFPAAGLVTMGIFEVGVAQAQIAAGGTQPMMSAGAGPETSVSTPASSVQNGGTQGQLTAVVVTAQRRAQSLQDVPISVAVATSAELAAVGIQTTEDLSEIVPGLSVPQTGGYYQPHIRGVGTSSNGPGIENPVAVYIDGVYVADPPSSLMALNSIERIEVLKGPQGTLFGRNATGGVIRVITRDPQYVSSMDADVTYGNFQDVTADVYATTGLSRDLAADIAVRYERQGEGWGRNLFDGSEVETLPHDFAGRTKWLFEPASATHVRMTLDYEDRDSTRDIQHLGRQYPGTFNNAVFGGPFPQGDVYDVDIDQPFVSKLKAGGASLQVNQDFDAVGLETITAYRKSSYFFVLDLDLTPANLLSAPSQADDQQFSQEVRIFGKSSKLSWTAGLYYFYAQDGWDPFDVDFGPIVSPVPDAPSTARASNDEFTNSAAAYGQATYEVLDGTRLTMGTRYTYERKAVDGTEALLLNGTPVSETPYPSPGFGIPAESSFNRFNYRAALDHKFGPGVLGYLSYSTGFKSGGYNLTVSNNPPYKPEDIKAAEMGLKSELLGRRLRLNVAAYNYLYDNIQVGQYLDNSEIITNAARAKMYGADVDAEIVVARGLTLIGGFSYIHDRFTSFPDADFIVPVMGCAPVPGGVCPGSATGKELPYTPTTSFNLGADYAVEVPFGLITLSANYYRSGSFYGAPDNVAVQPAYDLVNASLSWTDRDDHLWLKFFGRNLGNSLYYTSLIEGAQGEVVSLGAPRTYGITVGYKF